MKMLVNVLCDPPLGQSTILPPKTEHVSFTVFVESSKSLPDRPWEVVVWHNFQWQQQWTGTSLGPDLDNHCISIQSSDRPPTRCRRFKGVIALPPDPTESLKFTIKYRSGHDQPWSWINAHSAIQDGEIIVQRHLPSNPYDILPGSGPNFIYHRVTSDVPKAKIWHCKHAIGPAGQGSAHASTSLGIPVKQSKWFALARLWTPWLIPHHGGSKFDISQDAVVASFLRSDGGHVVVLALSGIENITTVLRAGEDGSVIVCSKNDDPISGFGKVLFAVAHSHATAMAACVYYARRLVSNFESQSVDLSDQDIDMTGIDTKWYQEWPDGLTYCTWNGIGQNLTEEKILNAVDDLNANGIQIMNLIIDDNWQSVDRKGVNSYDYGWTQFEADRKAFPNGLAETVSRIKRKMPRMQTIAVWHAIVGYWGGISPEGELAKKYKTKRVKRSAMHMPGYTHPETEITLIDEQDIQRFYNDFYAFLDSCGVYGVKTDAQFLLDQLKDPEDRRTCTKAYQDAWSISGLRHFQSRRISCMSQVPQIIFHSQLLTNTPKTMVRNSDDYYPDAPGSHEWHIFTNAYTATFTEYLNVIPDWDMFQTSHAYGSFHAAARCISGGPISFTDIPGEHDMRVLEQTIVRTTQGDTVTLRLSRAAKVIEDQVYIGYEKKSAVKIGNYNGGKGSGVGFIGIFNIADHPVSDFVKLTQFPGVEPDEEYVVHAYLSGETSGPTSGTNQDPLMGLFLQPRGWDILTSHALLSVNGIESKVAPLGLLGKMAGAAATLRFDVEAIPGPRLKMSTTLKSLGTFGLYISDLPSKTIADHFLITLMGEAIPIGTVSISDSNENLLVIDVTRAWNELGMHAGWGNEVIITVYMA